MILTSHLTLFSSSTTFLKKETAMFRRAWSGLPKDPYFPRDLDGLGYFINEQDEIRNKTDEEFYFKFFYSKNERVNDCQRFAFNGASLSRYLQLLTFILQEAINDIVRGRLEALGLRKTLLPLDISDPSHRHVPIYASPDLQTKSRTVLIVGERSYDLGILALRTINGKGGINQGSLVSVVHALLAQPSSATDPAPPGIVIANPGALWWVESEKKSLNMLGVHGAPRRSAVHSGKPFDDKVNLIPGNENGQEHVRYVLEKVIGDHGGVLDVLVVGTSAEFVAEVLDSPEGWKRFGPRLGSMVISGGYLEGASAKTNEFKRFLAEVPTCPLLTENWIDILTFSSAAERTYSPRPLSISLFRTPAATQIYHLTRALARPYSPPLSSTMKNWCSSRRCPP